jgi:hypothetical protein
MNVKQCEYVELVYLRSLLTSRMQGIKPMYMAMLLQFASKPNKLFEKNIYKKGVMASDKELCSKNYRDPITGSVHHCFMALPFMSSLDSISTQNLILTSPFQFRLFLYPYIIVSFGQTWHPSAACFRLLLIIMQNGALRAPTALAAAPLLS